MKKKLLKVPAPSPDDGRERKVEQGAKSLHGNWSLTWSGVPDRCKKETYTCDHGLTERID